MKSNVLDRVLTVVLIVVACIVGANALRSSGATKTPDLVREAKRAPAFKQWRSIDSAGYVLRGPQNAPVVIAVFADLQCPSCRGFHRNLLEASSRHRNDVRLVYLSFPLDYHEHALSGAKATDCVAQARGDLEKWFDLVYSKQDSIGMISWSAFANAAGVADTAFITQCANSPSGAAMLTIRRSQAWARQIDITGTPTILVNGRKLSRTPSAYQLDTLIALFARQR